MAAENGVEAEGTQESNNNTENVSQETESSSPEKSTAFHSKSPCEHCQNFNVYWILVMKRPKCFWHDYYKIALYAITRFLRGERGLSSVSNIVVVTHKNGRRWKPISIPLLKRRTKTRIN